MQTAGADHRVPILRGLLRGELAHLELCREGMSGAFKKWAAMIRLPGLLLIGDDDHSPVDGPDAWPIARRAFQWTNFVLLHGGAGDASHYEMAVGLTKQYRRLLIVECSSATLPAWRAAASRWCRGTEGLAMEPPPGTVHPSALSKGEVH